ncbi:MAG: aldo/keto reductase [Cryobacterium sp.]|nr:aldo/keto reductase [Cryobacterium sp.]
MPIPNRTLNDGSSLPAIGFGTYQLHGDEGMASVLSAIESGYRLIDTALNYENEAEVGQAIRTSGLDRSELIITSKLPGRFHGEGKTREGFMESLENLGLDYLDLFLIHWPLPRIDKYLQTWIELIQLKSEGLIRSIGVSNFTRSHLEKIISESGVVPAVNQIELHPHFPQAEMRKLHGELGIQTESWTPLARQRSVLQNPVIVAVSDAHNVTPAQAVLRWHIQLGTIPLPKSAQRDRQEENLDIFDFELSEVEMDQISGLESGRLWGGDPDTNEEF